MEFRDQWDHSGTSKSRLSKRSKICFIFKKTKTMYTNLVPETVNYINYASKFLWNLLYLFIICTIYLESSTKKYFLQLEHLKLMNNWFSSKTINIRVDFIYKCPLGWGLGILSGSLTYCFSFFPVNRNIWRHFLYFRTRILQSI